MSKVNKSNKFQLLSVVLLGIGIYGCHAGSHGNNSPTPTPTPTPTPPSN